MLDFLPVPLYFQNTQATNVFGLKNNKTVAETLAHRRYAHLSHPTQQTYEYALSEPLGTFLLNLKMAGDLFYRKFLNKYGDQTYCTFSIRDFTAEKGVYAWIVNDTLHYIGRSHDPFGKRINSGYGRIAPKNCYLDGQATNCHLNALIAANIEDVSFSVCPIDDDETIDLVERELIRLHKPKWNIALKA